MTVSKHDEHPLLDPAFIRKLVDPINAGAKIIQFRMFERERVRGLFVALVHLPKAMSEMKTTRPPSVLMSEKIKELREWSRTRARPAATPEA